MTAVFASSRCACRGQEGKENVLMLFGSSLAATSGILVPV